MRGVKFGRVVDGVLFDVDGKTLIAYPAGNAREKYVVPDGVETTGDCAFWNCDALTSVEFPTGLKSIGDSAFYSCDALSSVALPDGLKTIGDRAFKDCSSLMSVALPDSIQSVGDAAFMECHSFVLYGSAGSFAEEYAKKQGLDFRAR